MGLRNISLISLTAFPCSLAVSLKDLAKSFPNWIVLGREGSLLRISENESPNLAAQVLNSIDQYRMLVPEGFFREGDDLSAIMKTIETIDERRNANHRPSQLTTAERASPPRLEEDLAGCPLRPVNWCRV